MHMPLLILTGTGVRDTREGAPSATEALQLLRLHKKLRREAFCILGLLTCPLAPKGPSGDMRGR
jgi:hypothetical protein